ncbi:hypothetical protein Pfo_025575 [Paulownia fortunei]|nr:hypothetical protein Pfo_025575 [Paulownia fortunei]
MPLPNSSPEEALEMNVGGGRRMGLRSILEKSKLPIGFKLDSKRTPMQNVAGLSGAEEVKITVVYRMID